MTEFEQIKAVLRKHGYEYLQSVGNGSFSEVFLCKSTKYFDLFAVKRVFNQNKQIQSEYDALVHLNHPHIIKLYEVFNDENSHFLVMEYCSNNTLKQKGKLDYYQFIYYAKQILEALSHCHKNKIAHRDIKPENIFIDKYNRIKLADFGLSKQFDHESYSNENCGSLMYCSPEALSNLPYNPFHADIWALGISFYFMAVGQYPYPHHSTKELIKLVSIGHIDFSNANIHPEIKSLLQKMTAIDPSKRPSANEILDLSIFKDNKLESKSGFFHKPKLNKVCPRMRIDAFHKSSYDKDFEANIPLALSQSHTCRSVIANSDIYTRKIAHRPSQYNI